MSKKKFLVSGWVSMSVCAEVEAETRGEAEELFLELQAPSLCHQCDGAGGEGGTFGLNGFDDSLHVVDCMELSGKDLLRNGEKEMKKP